MSFLGAFAKLRKASLHQVRPSGRMERLGSHRTDFHNAIKYDVWGFLGNLSRKLKLH